MSRYTGPSCRICRRQGIKLFLKGERCYTPKCAIERRRAVPGASDSGNKRRRRLSEYGVHLREKQKARYIYGVGEAQFRRHYADASKQKGPAGENLLRILESRLDNIVFRLGWADSRKEARQIVSHGHISLNGRRSKTPSIQVKTGDKMTWMERSRNSTIFEIAEHQSARRNSPEWLQKDAKSMQGTMMRLPERQDQDVRIDDRLIVEYYSR